MILSNPFPVSVFTSASALGKHISLAPTGKPIKHSLGQLTSGVVETKWLTTLNEFADLRASLTTHQALAYGVCDFPRARVTTQKKLSAARRECDGEPVVARDAAHFRFHQGAGLMMIDYDPAPQSTALDAQALRAALCEAMPALTTVSMLWASSAGSCIYAGEREVIGQRGSRLYFLVSDAQLIPLVGRQLYDRLVLKGHGRIDISGAGTFLRRCLIDCAVWQAERLDYVKSTCSSGLEQRSSPWELLPKGSRKDNVNMLDTAIMPALSAPEIARVAYTWRGLEDEDETKHAAKERRMAWAHGKAEQVLGATASAEQLTTLSGSIASTLDGGVLDPALMLHLRNGRSVSVAEVCENEATYVGVRCADPLEPEYRDDRRIAQVGYEQGRLAVWSYAHGGSTYYLEAPSTAEEDFGRFDAVTVLDPRDLRAARTIATDLQAGEGSAQGASLLPQVLAALRSSEICGWHIGFDSFKAEWMVADADDGPLQWRALLDTDYTRLREYLQSRRSFKAISREMIRDAFQLVAQENTFDSAQTWLDRLTWDGIPRVETFLQRYFGAANSLYHAAVSRYIWSALAGRVIEPGVKCDMVPVAVGVQGTRKSSSIAAMVPSAEFFGELDLQTRDADTSRKLRGKLLVELAELRGLRGRDAESIKSFLSGQVDNWIPKYQEMAVNNPRRCLFFGSSNRDDFLNDDSGHRRWLPFYSGNCDPDSLAHDCEQLWAEGAVLFKSAGVAYSEAERLARHEHEKFEDIDEWTPMIAAFLSEGRRTSTEADEEVVGPFEYVALRDVIAGAIHIESSRISKADEKRAASVMRRIGWTNGSKRVARVPTKVWFPPPDRPL